MYAFLSLFRLVQPRSTGKNLRHGFSPALLTLCLLCLFLGLAPVAQAVPDAGTAADAAEEPRQTAPALPSVAPSQTALPESSERPFAEELDQLFKAFSPMILPEQGEGRPSLLPPHGGGIYVDTSLRWLADPSGKLEVKDILPRKAEFQPLDTRKLPHQAASLWLRLEVEAVDAAQTAHGEEARLDLGEQLPGTAQVWTVKEGAAPRRAPADEHGLFDLDELREGGEVLIRLEAMPGLWFKPAFRSPAAAINAPEKRAHSLALAMLTVLLMLAFVRSITERGDGRIWAGIFAGAALLQAFQGIPATPDGSLPLTEMPGLVATAVALMLLPHVGRSIMRTRLRSPFLDILLLILALPGAALALLPLFPEYIWLTRFIDLWPLGAVFSLLPALIMLLRRQHGSLLFTLACLAMTGGSVAGLWGLDEGIYAPLWGQAPLLGVCVAALLLAAAAPRSAYVECHEPALPSPADMLEIDHFDNAAAPAPQEVRLNDVEERLRGPLDELMRQCCVLDRALHGMEHAAATLSPETQEQLRRARHDTASVLNAAATLAEKIIGMAFDPSLTAPAPAEETKDGQPSTQEVFELRQLVSRTFAAVQNDAAEKNLGLSWYIAPHIALRYRGDAARLSKVLVELLNDAVRATSRGNVGLRVRREEKSANPGHLRFTIADSGHGAPPARRSALALAHAWELSAEHGGELSMESSANGVTISFSLNCVALDASGQAVAVPPTEAISGENAGSDGKPLLILASDHAMDRQIFAWQLRSEGHETWEARGCAEAVELYKTRPAALVLLDGHMPDDDIVRAIAEIRRFEGEHSLPLVPVLGLALQAEQADSLRQAGCDYLLLQPLERQELCSAVKMLLAGDSVALQMLRRRSSENKKPKNEPAAAPATPAPAPRPRLKMPDNEISPAPRPVAEVPAPAVQEEKRETHKEPLPPVKMPESPLIQTHLPSRPLPVPFPSRRLEEEKAQEEEPEQQEVKKGWFSSLFRHDSGREKPSTLLPESSEEANEWVGEPSPVSPPLSLTAPTEEEPRVAEAEKPEELSLDMPRERDLPQDGSLSLSAPSEELQLTPSFLPLEKEEEIIDLTEAPQEEIIELTEKEQPRKEATDSGRADIVTLTTEDMVTPGPELSAEDFLSRLTPDDMRNSTPPIMQLEDLADIRREIHAALTGGDVLQLSQLAMLLRRCAECFGLHSLTDLAALLQECALAQDIEAVRVLMPNLDQAVDRELPPELRWTKEI